MVDDNNLKKEFTERMRYSLDASELTKESISKAFEVSPQAVGKWFSLGTISSSKIPLVAEMMEVNLLWLLTGKGSIKDSNNIAMNVPVISYFQAKNFSSETNIHASGYAKRWLPSLIESSLTYIVAVKGDAMTSSIGVTFPEGILLHIDASRRTPQNNDFVFAIQGDNLTFKQYKTGENTPYLHSLNPNHKNYYDDFEVVGTVASAEWDL